MSFKGSCKLVEAMVELLNLVDNINTVYCTHQQWRAIHSAYNACIDRKRNAAFHAFRH